MAVFLLCGYGCQCLTPRYNDGVSGLFDRRSFVGVATLAFLIAGLVLGLRSCRNEYAQLLRRGKLHANRQERTAAVAVYRQAASLHPHDPHPHLELAQVYFDWGRSEQALEALSAAERLGAELAEVERLRVRVHARAARTTVRDRLSHWQAVADHAQRVLQLEPSDAETRMMLAHAYLQLRKGPAAQSAYEEVLVSNPSDAEARERLGALMLGDDPKAIEHLSVSGTELSKRLLTTFMEGSTMGESSYVHAKLGRVLIEREEWALAAHHLERATLDRPDYSDARAYLGHALDQMGYREAAESQLMKAVNVAPMSVIARVFLGLHHDRWGDTKAARLEYEKAHDMAPRNPAICVEVGQTWAAEGRYVAAEIWLREAVSLRPHDPALWEVLARFYLDRNITSSNRATEAVERLVQLSPNSAQAHDLRGWAAFQTGRYETAESHLQRAIALDASLAPAYYHLGLLRSAQGRESEANEAFDRAVDLDTTGELIPLVERAR